LSWFTAHSPTPPVGNLFRNTPMPLVRFDLVRGRDPQEIADLLDATHRVLVLAFGIPERDRYQIVNEHPATHFVVQDTGLGIARRTKSSLSR
jgi:hypothetical protein